MSTRIEIDGTRFLLNGRPTYEGVRWRGKPIEGLLFNSRMIQAIFDDENPATRDRWRYPDTGVWDPDRNTNEFCAALPLYRAHGLLAVTVGLQGGGSIYTKEVYDNYVCSAYTPEGNFKPAYFDRLLRVIQAADRLGMVVIVNLFYWKQAARLRDERTAIDIAEHVAEWLLRTGHENILVDVVNESADWWPNPIFRPNGVHRLIEAVKGMSINGRRLLVGSSSAGGDELPRGKWLEVEDLSMPHGNGCTPEELIQKLHKLRADPAYRARPRPIVINEDSIFVENLEAAAAEYVSWGYYSQGYGSGYRDRMDWTVRPREDRYEDLSGYQTLPVNWGINTAEKRTFFEKLKEITQGR